MNQREVLLLTFVRGIHTYPSALLWCAQGQPLTLLARVPDGLLVAEWLHHSILIEAICHPGVSRWQSVAQLILCRIVYCCKMQRLWLKIAQLMACNPHSACGSRTRLQNYTSHFCVKDQNPQNNRLFAYCGLQKIWRERAEAAPDHGAARGRGALSTATAALPFHNLMRVCLNEKQPSFQYATDAS